MHRLLQRQLKKYLSQNLSGFTNDLSDLNSIPLEWQNFLKAVDEAYAQHDAEYRMVERLLDLSSEELLQANNQLREMLTNVEGKVAERTAELIEANSELEQALTDLQQMQVHLIQAEKMSALGHLQQFAFKPATNNNIKPIAGLRPATLLVAGLIELCCNSRYRP